MTTNAEHRLAVEADIFHATKLLDREGKVLSSTNVDHLRTVQAALLKSHHHIGNALVHVAAMLASADENHDTAVHVGVHGRNVLTEQLRTVRGLKRGI